MASTPIKGPKCTVCSHPDRHRIEMLRLGGATGDALAEQFGIGRDSLYRHMAKHCSAETKAAIIADVPLVELAERARAESMSLIDYLHLVRSTVISQMLVAQSVNDGFRVATLAKRAVEILREIGRLTGEIMRTAPITNITNNTVVMGSPFYTRLEAMLLARLKPHPDALRAVLVGLDELSLVDTQETPPLASPVALEHAHA